MGMDLLRSCYSSYMRLYPDDPDRLTLGHWRFCPDGAEPVPFPHAFCSSVWDPDQWGSEYPLGEIAGYHGRFKGLVLPRLPGLNYCGAVPLWQGGSPLALRGTPPVDDEGVPLCCQTTRPALGGCVADGSAILSNWTDVGLWLRPEELAGLVDGDTITDWPQAPLTPRAGTPAGDYPLTYLIDGLTGYGGGLFKYHSNLSNRVDYTQLDLLDDFTTYVVGRALGPTPNGPYIAGVPAGGFVPGVTFARAAAQVDAGNNLIGPPTPGTRGLLLFWSVMRKSNRLAIRINGVEQSHINDGGPVAGYVNRLSAGAVVGSATGLVWIPEVIVYPRALSVGEDQAVWDYLAAKYVEVSDVLPGSLVAFAGSALPPGYLACNGSAVSRTTYAVLFGAIGTTWGVGDGMTTFGLPDLRDRTAIGTSPGGLGTDRPTTRALADVGGEENHTLTNDELPPHAHPVAWYPVEVEAGVMDTQVNSVQDWSTPYTSPSGPDGNEFSHNTMQPFATVQWLIKT